jgi:hypothetical protein
MPKPPISPKARNAAAVVRQQRYRAAKTIASFDVERVVVERLQELRGRTGQSNAQLLTRALDLLEAELAAPLAKPVRRRAPPSASSALATAVTSVPQIKAKHPSPVDGAKPSRQGQLDLLADLADPPATSRRKR